MRPASVFPFIQLSNFRVTDERRRLFEVYAYGYDGDAYGKEATAIFCDFERPEVKFASVEELKERVMKDMRYGIDYFNGN